LNQLTPALPSKSYAYFTDLDLTVGDWTIVMPRDWPVCVKVVQTENIPEKAASKATKYILQKLDI